MRPTAILRDDPKLARIADALRDAFGSRLVSALLFGSRARGDHRADSDYDVAVFLDDYDHVRDSEILRQARDTLGEDVFTVQLRPFASHGLSERTTLMFNIRNDAVPLPGLAWPAVIAPPIAPDEGPMKPETKNLLDGAEQAFKTANALRAAGFNKPAAREAYQAVLRAARALIFENRQQAPMDQDLGLTLSHGLALRMDVDYEPIPQTTEHHAAEYVDRAEQFIAKIKSLIA